MEVGHQLSTARQQRGLTLDDVSRATKIPLSILDAIERNDTARLPQGFFTRAFVRAYAREVGVNADDLLDNSEVQTVPLDTRHGHVPIEDQTSSTSLFAGIAIGVVCTMIYSGYASQTPVATVAPQVAIPSVTIAAAPAPVATLPCVAPAPGDTLIQSVRQTAAATLPSLHVGAPAEPIPVTHVVSGNQSEPSANVVESAPAVSDAILPTTDPAPANVEQF